MLDDPAWQLRSAVQHHLDDIGRRVDLAQSLRARLARIAAELTHHDSPSSDELFAVLEKMTMLDSTVHSTTALLVYDDPAGPGLPGQVFGLTAGPVERDGNGRAIHAEVRAGGQVIWLHPAAEQYKSPRALGAATGMTVIAVDDADAHHARSLAAGAEIIEDPADQD